MTRRDHCSARTCLAVQQAVQQAGVELADLANRACLGRARLQRRLDGLVPFTTAELERIAVALDVDPATLTRGGR